MAGSFHRVICPRKIRREDRAGQAQRPAAAGEGVVGDRDGAEVDGNLKAGPPLAPARSAVLAGTSVAPKFDLPGGEPGDAGAAADGGVPDGGVGMGLLVGGERRAEERRVER